MYRVRRQKDKLNLVRGRAQSTGIPIGTTFFDFTFEFPKGWFPHGEATKERIKELGAAEAAASGLASNAEVAVAQKHTYNLLTVFENELGSPGVRFFRSELVTVTDVSFEPGIRTGEDYLLDVQPLLKKLGYEEFSLIRPVELGGRSFYQVDVKRELHGNGICQSYVVTILRGYALGLVVTTENKDATAQLVKGLVLRFGPRAAAAETRNARVAAAATDAIAPQESGSFQSGVYRNTYFGLTYRLPYGWYVDTNIFKQHLQENVGKSSVPVKRTFVLLSANQYAPGTPGVSFNPALVIMVDEAAPYLTVHSGKDYLPKVTRALVQNQQVEVIQEGDEAEFGGRQFYRADYKRTERAKPSYQSVLCTVWHDYVFSWTFVGSSMSELSELVSSMHDISFDRRGADERK